MQAESMPTTPARSKRSPKVSGGPQSVSESAETAEAVKKSALAAPADTNFRMIGEARTTWDLNKLTYCMVIQGCIARISRTTRLHQ